METSINRTMKWLNIVFLAINSSAIISMLIFGFVDTDKKEKFDSMVFLRDELDLTNEQYIELSHENDQVMRKYQTLLDLSCETNFAMMDELSKDEPSMHVLDSLADRFGMLNTNAKKQAVRHFMNIKTICTDEQKANLSKLYKEMMELDKQCEICNKKECPRKERLKEIDN